jgi:hypothetical protein
MTELGNPENAAMNGRSFTSIILSGVLLREAAPKLRLDQKLKGVNLRRITNRLTANSIVSFGAPHRGMRVKLLAAVEGYGAAAPCFCGANDNKSSEFEAE